MVIYYHHNPDFRNERCPHKAFRQMLAYELVQPYLDDKANPNLDTSVTRGRLSSIPSVRLSGKRFPSGNYPVCKSCVVCAHEKNRAGKYEKTKTSDFCEKCNGFVCKNWFERYHIRNHPKGLYVCNIYVYIFAMKVAFSSLYCVFRIFLLIIYLFIFASKFLFEFWAAQSPIWMIRLYCTATFWYTFL